MTGIINKEQPEIISSNSYYAIYATVSTTVINFYDGIIRGLGLSNSATVNVPAGKQIVRNTATTPYTTTLN